MQNRMQNSAEEIASSTLQAVGGRELVTGRFVLWSGGWYVWCVGLFVVFVLLLFVLLVVFGRKEFEWKDWKDTCCQGSYSNEKR